VSEGAHLCEPRRLGDYRGKNFRDIEFDNPGYAGQNEPGKSSKGDDAQYLKDASIQSGPEGETAGRIWIIDYEDLQ
jgi:hypothetical protein